METPTKVIVAGGGLAGLALCIGLSKYGVTCSIFEQASEHRLGGVGLALAPNGLRSLDLIVPGLAAQLIDQGQILRSLAFLKKDGQVQHQQFIDYEQSYGYPMLSIRWSVIKETLAALIDPSLVKFGKRAISAESDDNFATVNFQDGDSARAELLIGADGVHSHIRSALVADQPSFCGTISARAVVSVDGLTQPTDLSRFYVSSDSSSFRITSVGDGLWAWSCNSKVEIQPEAFAKSSSEQVKARIVRETTDWSEEIKILVAATPAEAILELPVMERHALSTWHNKRIVLIGDAAHGMPPFLGQGANMAFEDAYFLGELLGQWQKGALSLEQALELFDSLQLPRSNTVLLRSSHSLKNLRETAGSAQRINDFYLSPEAVATPGYSKLAASAADLLAWIYSGPEVVQI
jgi:salicylate hydroxylase